MDLSLDDSQIEDRYLLHGRVEILSCFNDLIRTRESVTVYFNKGQDFLLTTLLEASPSRLLFDLGGDQAANRRLEKSGSGCTFMTVHDGIRIQFSAAAPERLAWRGGDAFRVPLPQRVFRMQRRDSYRVALPINKPVLATVLESEDAGDSGLLSFSIHDLSVGGIGLAAHGDVPLEAGNEVDIACTIGSDRYPLRAHAQVRHVTVLGRSHRDAATRIGIGFGNLPVSVSAHVQRYLLQVEHQRSALSKKSG